MSDSRARKQSAGYPPAYIKFWLNFEISPAKLALFRVLFFGVFALDAWLQVAHAPRYGFLDFNVGHFPFLDGLLPMPTRTSMVLIYGAEAYLALRIALGGAHRATYIALASLFAYGYFVSQLNSYQHHYLLAIALALIAAFPWPQPAQDAAERVAGRAQNWPVRMLLVAMSVMYLFAVLAKLDVEWTNGSTLRVQLQEGLIRDIAKGMGWATTAKLALVTELLLALLIQWRRAWPLALVLGTGMHMCFHWAGLKIGLFSYFMVTLYALILPETWIALVASKTAAIWQTLARVPAQLDAKLVRSWLVYAAGLTLGLALLQLVPVDAVNLLTLCISILAIAEVLTRWKRAGSAGLTHLIAIAVLLLIVHQTDSLRDYYRFWGGNERRAGNTFEAMMAYENVVELAPDYAAGHKSLGDLYLKLHRDEDALVEYRAGLSIAPNDFGLNRAAAQLLHAQGEGQAALDAAERGLASNAKDQSLRAIREHWRRQLRLDAP